MNESAIFKAAVKLAPDQRHNFVAAACAGHPQLSEDVEALLHEHDEAGSFISRPALKDSPTDLFRPTTEGPGTRIGPYKLREQIGEGGLGSSMWPSRKSPSAAKSRLKSSS